MISYDQVNHETFPERSFNGGGFSTGDVMIEHVQMMHELDLEVGK